MISVLSIHCHKSVYCLDTATHSIHCLRCNIPQRATSCDAPNWVPSVRAGSCTTAAPTRQHLHSPLAQYVTMLSTRIVAPTILQKRCTIQIQFLDPRVASGLSNKISSLCSSGSTSCMRSVIGQHVLAFTPAGEESTPIQALFAPALKIFLHSARFCYPVCYPVGPVQQPAANFL